MKNSFFDKTISKIKRATVNKKIAAFFVIGVVAYLTYSFVMENKKEHFENKNGDVICTFYAFDYCGYCKKFQPTWDAVKRLKFDDNVLFRYYEANKMSKDEKAAIQHYVDPQYAPMVILTVNGKNIEFEQQSNVANKGLEEFIRSHGTMYAKH